MTTALVGFSEPLRPVSASPIRVRSSHALPALRSGGNRNGLRPAIPREAEAREAEKHHYPSGGFGDCSADGEVDAEAAGYVGDEAVPIVRSTLGPKLEPRSKTRSWKKPSTTKPPRVASRISIHYPADRRGPPCVLHNAGRLDILLAREGLCRR